MSIFAERLKQLRGEESQASFAEQIGINRVQYFKYESGKNSPSIDILARICQVHSVSADWLLGLNKSSDRQNFSVKASHGGIAIGGNVSGTIVTPGVSPTCLKCPFKKKLQALEKVLGKPS